MFLDEAWLAAVLTRQPAPLAAIEEAGGAAAVRASPAPVQLSPAAETPIAHARAEPAVSRRVDWVGALDVSHFAGRRNRSATVIEQSALVGKIGQWENPLLSDEELAGLLGLEQKSVRSSLSTLHTLGCLEPISTSVSHVASPSSSSRQLVFHRHAEKEVT